MGALSKRDKYVLWYPVFVPHIIGDPNVPGEDIPKASSTQWPIELTKKD